MNIHLYTLSKLNEQKLASLQNDIQLSITSKVRGKNIISKLQNFYAKVFTQKHNHQHDLCCPQT